MCTSIHPSTRLTLKGVPLSSDFSLGARVFTSEEPKPISKVFFWTRVSRFSTISILSALDVAIAIFSGIMLRLRPSRATCARPAPRTPCSLLRRSNLSPLRSVQTLTGPYVLERCPDPTCPCSSMPSLEKEIDYEKPLTMSAYSQHLIISTGKSDWKSRIEDERDNGTTWGQITGDLKTLLGRKGGFRQVCVFVHPSCAVF